MEDLYLASRSPRRARILEAAGIAFRFGPMPDVDESLPAGLAPPAAAQALAERKARAVAARLPDRLLLCADTLVYLGEDEVLGKPLDPSDAMRMLTRLSGRTHRVATGVALARGPRLASGVDVARVSFRSLDPTEIRAYVAGGEPLDKAGAYAIQGGARGFVECLEGSRDTVVGLPLALLGTLRERLRAGGLGSEGVKGR